MKTSFLFFAIIFFGTAHGQLATNVLWTMKSTMPANEVIYYDKDRSLLWDNFAGPPGPENGMTAALTVSGFGYTAGIHTINGKGNLNISVYCYFNKNKSWVKPGKKTSYILTHEQRHFDISFLAAAIFVDKLQAAKFTPTNYNVLLPRIYNESCDIMNRMQKDYDGQTKNGQVKAEQLRWNGMIDDRINSTID